MQPTSVLLLLLSAYSAQAGFFDDVSGMASDVGNFFTTQFTNVKELFASNQSELEKNIEKVKELLRGVKEKTAVLEPFASDAQKETLNKVDSFTQQVDSFQSEVKAEGSAKFEENKSKWEDMVKNIFETGGLSSIVKLIASQSAGSLSATVLCTLLPVLLLNR